MPELFDYEEDSLEEKDSLVLEEKDSLVLEEEMKKAPSGFLDGLLTAWIDDFKLYGLSYVTSFNLLGEETRDSETDTGFSDRDRALKGIRKEYLEDEEVLKLTGSNGGFWDKAAVLATEILRPSTLGALFVSSGTAAAIRGLPQLQKAGAIAAEWASNTFGRSAKYLGSALRGSSEMAAFETTVQGERALAELPVEDFGKNVYSAALFGGMVNPAFKAAGELLKPVTNYIKELNWHMIYPERMFKTRIEPHPKGGEPVLSIESEANIVPEKKFVPLPKILVWGPLAKSWNSSSRTVRTMSEAYFGNMYSRTETEGMASVTDLMTFDRVELCKLQAEYYRHVKSSGLSEKAFNEEWLNASYEGANESLNSSVNGFAAKTRKTFKEYGERGVKSKAFGDFEKKIQEYNRISDDLEYKALELEKAGEIAKEKSKSLKEIAKINRKKEALKSLGDLEESEVEHGKIADAIEAEILDIEISINAGKEEAELLRHESLMNLEKAQAEENFRNRILNKPYFPCYVDKNKINQDLFGWKKALQEGLEEANSHKRKANFRKLVDQITEEVFFTNDFRFTIDGSTISKSLKKRKLRIKQKYIKDYLISSPIELMDSYVTSMGFNIAENTVLERLGYESFKDVEKAYYKEIGGAVKSKKRSDDLELLRTIPYIVCGQFDKGIRRRFDEGVGGSWLRQAIGALQDLKTASSLGMLGITGIADLAANGAKGTTCRHISEIVRNCFGSFEGLSREEIKSIGLAGEDALSNLRYLSLEITENIEGALGEKISRFRSAVTRPIAQKVIDNSLIKYVDGIRETAAASLSSRRLAEEILGGSGKVEKLKGEVLERIKEQLNKYKTETPEGLIYYNIESWEDELAREDFKAAIRREVRREIFKPNPADIPNAARANPLVKIFSMFNSFNWGIRNSVILPMYSEGRYGELAALCAYTFGYEALTLAAKAWLMGKAFDLNSLEDVKKLMFRALERTPLIDDLMTGASVITFGQFGESKIKSGNDLLRTLGMGGAASYAFDAFDAGKGAVKFISGRDRSKKTFNRIMKIIPFQNAWNVRPLLNIMTSDLPEGGRSGRKK